MKRFLMFAALAAVLSLPGFSEPVTFAGKTLFNINAATGGKTALDRVHEVEKRLIEILGETHIRGTDVVVKPAGAACSIYVKKHLFVTCTKDDAVLTKMSVAKLAREWRNLIAKNIVDMHLLPNQVGPKMPSGEKR